MSSCKTCGETFDNGFALAVHIDSSHGVDHRCDRCGRVFKTKSAYTYHINHSLSCTDREQIRSTCDICGREFSSEHGMRMHRRFHDSEFMSRVGRKKGVHQSNAQCNSADAMRRRHNTWNEKIKSEMRFVGLTDHQIDTLMDKTSVISLLDGAKSVRAAAESLGVDRRYLDRAIARYGIKASELTTGHRPRSQKTFPCEECGTVFDSGKDRRSHVRMIHRTCGECGHISDSSENLIRHRINRHGAECPRCGRVVHRLINLEQCSSCYKRSRLVERQCPQCGSVMHVDLASGEDVVCVRCKRRNKAIDCICPDCGRQFTGSHDGQRCQSCQTKMNRDARPQGVCDRCGRGDPVDLIVDGVCHRCRTADSIAMTTDDRVARFMDSAVIRSGGDPSVVNSPDGMRDLIASCDRRDVYSISLAANVSYGIIMDRIHRFGLEDLVKIRNAPLQSQAESDWQSDIENVCGHVERQKAIYGDRRRCDLVVASIGIEVNPTYTHSTIAPESFRFSVERDYHYRRSRDAEANGYEIIHAWDWIPHDKMLSFIRSKLHADDHRISARKCDLVVVDSKTANRFYEANHIQGGLHSGISVSYALVYDDEIVAMSSYGKSRFDRHHEWEWLRYCSASGWHIYGGAGRMQKAFIHDEDPQSVVTYTDYSRSNGGMDAALGWSFLRYTGPSLVWWNGSRMVRDTSLLRVGADRILGTHYGSVEECGLDNHGIMQMEGYVGVYDCGSKVYELPL